MIFVFILCITFVIISLISSKNNIFSPGVLTSVVWVFCFALFWILNHNLPPLSLQFLGSLSIWVILFCFSSLLIQSTTTKINNVEPSQFVRDIFFWISVIAYPFFLLYVRDALQFGETGNWSNDLRLAALGKTSHFKEVYGGIHVVIWQVSYIIELYYFSKKNKYRVIILGLIFLSFGFFTMSKSIFLELFVKTICILFFKNRVKIKQVFLGVTALVLIFGIIQALRYSIDVNAITKDDSIVLYLISSMSAYDTLSASSSLHWGENVFRMFYAFTYKLGLMSIEPVDVLLEFIEKPIVTNTYTMMYPFFKDFGYTGIVLFSGFYGFFYGWVFNKAQRGSDLFVLIYATLILSLVVQYSSELLITNISGYVKQVFFLLLPFLAGKYKFFNIEIKNNK